MKLSPLLGRPIGSPRSSGGAFSAGKLTPEVIQFFDRLPVVPVSPVQSCYNNLIKSIVADGTFAALDVLIICAVDDSINSMVNLISSSFKPDLFHATTMPVFTQYRGWTMAGANSCIMTNFNPSLGVKYTQNAATFGVWSLADVKIAGTFWRSDVGVSIECWPFSTDNKTYTMANNSAAEQSTLNAVSDTLGLFVTQRTDSAGYKVYKNDVQICSYPAVSSVAPENNILKVGAGNGYLIGAYFAGGLSDSQKTTLYNALYSFLHDPSIGAV